MSILFKLLKKYCIIFILLLNICWSFNLLLTLSHLTFLFLFHYLFRIIYQNLRWIQYIWHLFYFTIPFHLYQQKLTNIISQSANSLINSKFNTYLPISKYNLVHHCIQLFYYLQTYSLIYSILKYGHSFLNQFPNS